MISQSVKDIVDLIASVGTVLGFFGLGVGWYITRRDAKNKGEVAIGQINHMATNCFPTMQLNLEDINKKTDTTNNILTELRLGQVETNTLLRGAKTTITIDKSGV